MKTTLFSIAAFALAAQTTAQSTMAGTGWRILANAQVRSAAGNGAGELIARFDADDAQGYGVEAAHPGMHVVHGVAIQWRDFGGSVPDGRCDVTLYPEDPARPNYPDLTNPIGGVLQVLPRGTGLFFDNVMFPTPLLVPEGVDLFVGVKINPTTFLGVRINHIPGSPSSVPYDLAGPGMPTAPPEKNSYELFRDLTTNTLTYQPRGQFMIDLLTRSPGGFATTLSGQSSMAPSRTAPGVTTMLSGLHPDSASPPLHTGRADDVGFLFFEPTLGAGALVMFFGAFANFQPAVPLSTVIPGSIGGFCLDSTNLITNGFGVTDSVGRTFVMTPIPPGARATLNGLSWTQQAVAIDPVHGTLLGTQCVRQQF